MLSDQKLYLLIGTIMIVILGTYFLNLQVLAEDYFNLDEEPSKVQVVEHTTLLPVAPPPSPVIAQTVKVIVTAYSSTIWETDETPHITASNKEVRDGIIANNLLTFGTKVRLPELFEDKVFEVQDRMSWRKGYYHVDIWFPSQDQALEFGAKLTEMEILAN